MQTILGVCIGTLCRIHVSPRHKRGSVPIGIAMLGLNRDGSFEY